GEVPHIVTHADRAPLGKDVGRRAAQPHQQVRAVAPALGRHLANLAVGGADPRPVAVHDTNLAPAIHDVLDTLPPRDLDPHALIAAGLRVAAVGVVDGERLLDVDVGDGWTRA